MVNRICILSDKRYLLFGLALCESIYKHDKSDNYVIHYLATDQETINKLWEINNLNIKIHTLNEIIESKDFHNLENKYPRRGGKALQDSPFHWAIAPIFSYYIMQKYQSSIMYADTDIMFYRDIDEIFQCVKDYTVGLVSHKNCSLKKKHPRKPFYNVGILYFKYSELGQKILKWWMECVIDRRLLPNGGKPGPFWDQMYLEFFGQLFGKNNIKLIDEDIGHGGPWSLNKSRIVSGDYIWESKGILDEPQTRQPLSFFHFSHFSPNLKNNSWDYDRWSELRLSKQTKERQDIIDLYQAYFDWCNTMSKKYDVEFINE